jgi:hypothetical protein
VTAGRRSRDCDSAVSHAVSGGQTKREPRGVLSQLDTITSPKHSRNLYSAYHLV